MNARFTPGPWSIGVPRKDMFGMIDVPVHVGEGDFKGNALALVHLGAAGALSNAESDVVANAQAIAAVPDLIFACQHALEFASPTGEQGPEYFPPSDVEWQALREILQNTLRLAGVE